MTAVFASPPEPGTRPTYPFAEWLDGRWWTLTQGRDFWGPVDSLVRSLEASARARGKTVQVVSVEGTSAIKVRGADRG